MSRLQVLVSQPRLALGAVLTLALASAAIVGSGADFTASSANPANTFSSGTLAISNSSSNAAVGTFAGGAPTCGDSDDVSVYTGALPGIGTSASPITLGTFNGGDKHRYKFTVSLDSTADNSYQGGTSTVDFNWTAG
jgi:hypothetical protein